jgi:CheY-specific phosphatase CheX
MSGVSPTLDAVLPALITSAQEIATVSLGVGELTGGAVSPGWPSDVAGAFVTLSGERGDLTVGITATHSECGAMTRRMLLIPEDEALDTADAIDAISELANILAGGVKSRMSHVDPTLRLGLPVFATDTAPDHSKASASVEFSCDDLTFHLVVCG